MILSWYFVLATGLDPASAAIFIGPNCLGVYGGILLWRGARRGYLISLALQAAQLVRISTSVVFYEFVLGFSFTVGAGVRSFFFYPKFGATGLISLTDANAPLRIGLNIVALASLIYLARQLKWVQNQPPVGDPVTTRKPSQP